MSDIVTPERISEAARLIRSHVRHTPVLKANMADFGLAQQEINLKLECLQHTGSFKVRGAFTNMLQHSVPAAGVAAASGGNHGAAVAYAAMKHGIPATIFVPSVTSPAKTKRIRSYGARLVVAGNRYADALAASEAFTLESGALAVHAFDQPETLIGQGTLGAEIEQELPDTDTLLVAVGGGGLIGGIAGWYRGRTNIVAVEPEGAPTLWNAFKAGRPVDSSAEGVAADSLAPRQVGHLMFPLAKAYVQRPLLVSDEDIRKAQRALWEHIRIVVEPGGAAAFAALLAGKYTPAADEQITVLLCGANTTAVAFEE